MTEQNRDPGMNPDDADRQGGSIDDGGMPQPGPGQTGVGREPWQDRSGEGDSGDMADAGDTDVTPPDTNAGERERQSTGG